MDPLQKSAMDHQSGMNDDSRAVKMDRKNKTMSWYQESSAMASSFVGFNQKSDLELRLTSAETFEEIYGRFLGCQAGMDGLDSCFE